MLVLAVAIVESDGAPLTMPPAVFRAGVGRTFRIVARGLQHRSWAGHQPRRHLEAVQQEQSNKGENTCHVEPRDWHAGARQIEKATALRRSWLSVKRQAFAVKSPLRVKASKLFPRLQENAAS